MALEQFYSLLIAGKLPTNYRFVVIADSEMVWAKHAKGFAAQVAAHWAGPSNEGPVWYGNCQNNLKDTHPTRHTWFTMSQHLSDREYTGALLKLQDKCTNNGGFPTNMHFVDLPIYDVASLGRFLSWMSSLSMLCDDAGKQVGAFEQPLYIFWSIVIEGVGKINSSIEPMTANQYPWTTRMRYRKDGTLDDNAMPSIQAIRLSGIMWATLHFAEKHCENIPEAVYILFHADYKASNEPKHGAFSPSCCISTNSNLGNLSSHPPYCCAISRIPPQPYSTPQIKISRFPRTSAPLSSMTSTNQTINLCTSKLCEPENETVSTFAAEREKPNTQENISKAALLLTLQENRIKCNDPFMIIEDQDLPFYWPGHCDRCHLLATTSHEANMCCGGETAGWGCSPNVAKSIPKINSEEHFCANWKFDKTHYTYCANACSNNCLRYPDASVGFPMRLRPHLRYRLKSLPPGPQSTLARFATLIGNRPVKIMGDSLMQQFYE